MSGTAWSYGEVRALGGEHGEVHGTTCACVWLTAWPYGKGSVLDTGAGTAAGTSATAANGYGVVEREPVREIGRGERGQ